MAEQKQPDPAPLLQIIGIQTEIAQLGQDVGAIMTLVTQRAQQLTRAGAQCWNSPKATRWCIAPPVASSNHR